MIFLIFSKAEEIEKSNVNQDKYEVEKQNQAQLKLSLPVNTDNSNLYNKYKIIKNANNTFESNA